jgi:diguanylate cyclase (GGDEF)-like protein/PAS domain S-box-containing protein
MGNFTHESELARQTTHGLGPRPGLSGRRRAARVPAVADAERRHRVFVEQLPLASYVERFDEESAAYISPQIFDLVGYTAGEWVADSGFFARVLHPGDRDHVLAAFAGLQATGDPVTCEYRLIARDGREVWIHDSAVVVRDDDGTPSYVQGYMIDITERKRFEESLRESETRLRQQIDRVAYQALHDSLTDLPNRTLFYDRTEQALREGFRNGTGLAVMLIDLDRFKEVNDTLGHLTGDQMLVEVGARLREAVRRSDTVARLGGDEFAVLAPGLHDPDDARQLAEKVRDAIGQPVVLGGLELEMEASVGISFFPENGTDVETLIRRADVSMYVSKSSHAPIVYVEEFDQNSLARLALVTELRRAIEDGELVVYYQPQADASTGRLRKLEALVRWEHPKHGLLCPDQFIPFAEETGLIRILTRYVIDDALRRRSEWEGTGEGDLTVAVNITGRDVVDLDFPDEVARLLGKWGIEPDQLELEITERTIMSDIPRARTVLARLSELGVKLAIDDFGTGHASIAHLRRLPISVLKIDKSFVLGMLDDLEDEALVRAAIDLGHNLGLEVVAEGVECEATAQRLQELGCDTVQGFHLGRPMRDLPSR